MAGRVAQLKKVKKSLIRTESGNEGFLLMEAEDLDEQIGLIEYRNGEVEVRKKTEYKKAYSTTFFLLQYFLWWKLRTSGRMGSEIR